MDDPNRFRGCNVALENVETDREDDDEDLAETDGLRKWEGYRRCMS